MTIESGTTGERLVRLAIFLLLCLAFTGWFGYDGFIGYPGKNLEWARQAMPNKPADLQINPNVVAANVARVERGMTVTDLTGVLGEPALVEPRQLTFLGSSVKAVVDVSEDGKVLEVEAADLDPTHAPDKPGYLVSRTRVTQIEKGLSEDEVITLLGQPAETRERTFWFVGPAIYCRVLVADGTVLGELRGKLHPDLLAGFEGGPLSEEQREDFKNKGVQLSEGAVVEVLEPGHRWRIVDHGRLLAVVRDGEVLNTYAGAEVQENTQRTESDIHLQKIIAGVLGVLTLVAVVKVVQVKRLRAVLDDTGLTFNRRHVPWDAMAGLDTSDYEDKRWLDLQHDEGGDRKLLRLDSYHIDRFDDIIRAICERKGYESPLKKDEGPAENDE